MVAKGLPQGASGLVRLSLIYCCFSCPPHPFHNQKEQLCKIRQCWMKENLEGVTGLIWVESLHPGGRKIGLILQPVYQEGEQVGNGAPSLHFREDEESLTHQAASCCR